MTAIHEDRGREQIAGSRLRIITIKERGDRQRKWRKKGKAWPKLDIYNTELHMAYFKP